MEFYFLNILQEFLNIFYVTGPRTVKFSIIIWNLIIFAHAKYDYSSFQITHVIQLFQFIYAKVGVVKLKKVYCLL